MSGAHMRHQGSGCKQIPEGFSATAYKVTDRLVTGNSECMARLAHGRVCHDTAHMAS